MPALNAALMRDGALIHVGRGIDVARPIELVFIGGVGDGPVGYHPRHLIVLEPGSSASVIETHAGGGAGRYLANHVTAIAVGDKRPPSPLSAAVRGRRRLSHRHPSRRDRRQRAATRRSRSPSAAGLARNEITRDARRRRAPTACSPAPICCAASEHCDNTTGSASTRSRTPPAGRSSRACSTSRRAASSRAASSCTATPRSSDGHQLSKALLLSDARRDRSRSRNWKSTPTTSSAATAPPPASSTTTRCSICAPAAFRRRQARRLLIEAFLAEVFDEIAEPGAARGVRRAGRCLVRRRRGGRA